MLGELMTKRLFARNGFVNSLRSKDSGESSGQLESVIRPATVEDCDAIREIYNLYVSESLISFEEEPTDIQYWHDKFNLLDELGLPFIVAVSDSLELLGFAYLAPWRQKSAYRSTAENSIYLKQSAIGYGLGPKLLSELLRLGKLAGIKEVVAVISDSGAETSIEMHKKFGFKKMGHLPRVGFKLNNWLGVNLMQKSL
jgi:phosphinothricin acetyltransferase